MQQREALEQREALDGGCLLLPTRRVREDALPENLDYADSGCDIWDRCLTCPLPRCRYDEPGGARQIFLRERDREVARLYRADVRETPEPRGKDIRAGVGAVPAVWED
jgi:hypothetical protein